MKLWHPQHVNKYLPLCSPVAEFLFLSNLFVYFLDSDFPKCLNCCKWAYGNRCFRHGSSLCILCQHLVSFSHIATAYRRAIGEREKGNLVRMSSALQLCILRDLQKETPAAKRDRNSCSISMACCWTFICEFLPSGSTGEVNEAILTTI